MEYDVAIAYALGIDDSFLLEVGVPEFFCPFHLFFRFEVFEEEHRYEGERYSSGHTCDVQGCRCLCGHLRKKERVRQLKLLFGRTFSNFDKIVCPYLQETK